MRPLETLRAYWKLARPAEPWLFPGQSKTQPITRQAIYQQFDQTVTAAGITRRIKFHSLRHAFATHLLEEGIDILTIQEMLGHANIATTQIYTAVEERRLLDQHAKFHPRNQG